jgi:cytochrome P450
MLRPNFVRSQVGDLPTFEKHVKHLVAAIPTDGSTVDLSPFFFRLTMDSATEFLFGESTEYLTKGSEEGFAESFTRGQDFIANMSRWGAWAKLFPANKQFGYDQKFVHDFVDYYVRKGLARRDQLLTEKTNSEKPGRYVFIDELVRQTTDPIQIRSELLNILLAGRDTTASLLTNVWFMLAKRPDIWSKLQAEIASLDGEVPTFEQLKNLKYLKALLNESLRLHPVVPANSREALEDTTLPIGGGPDGSAPLFIKKGQVVAWSVYSMHRRKDFYGEDAEEFEPERWIDDPSSGRKGLRPSWEYLPFNGGARICLGQQFALTEASYTTVRLCQAFGKIEKRDNAVWEESLTLTCVNRHGAKVALTPR